MAFFGSVISRKISVARVVGASTKPSKRGPGVEVAAARPKTSCGTGSEFMWSHAVLVLRETWKYASCKRAACRFNFNQFHLLKGKWPTLDHLVCLYPAMSSCVQLASLQEGSILLWVVSLSVASPSSADICASESLTGMIRTRAAQLQEALPSVYDVYDLTRCKQFVVRQAARSLRVGSSHGCVRLKTPGHRTSECIWQLPPVSL